MPHDPADQYQDFLFELRKYLQQMNDAETEMPAFSQLPGWREWLKADNDPASDFTSIEKLKTLKAQFLDDPAKSEAASRYWHAFQALQVHWIDISSKSWDTARMQSIEASSATNIRQFYDDWIEAGEALFRERAVTKQYARQVGEWINAQVDFNLAFGMGEVPVCVDPRDLKAALTEAEAREAQLRSELEALKSRQKTKPARATSKKKAPSKASHPTNTNASSKSGTTLKKSRPKP